ncbi:MAG: oligosaccharide flippase family protein [Alphaproteobacteria bacterium]
MNAEQQKTSFSGDVIRLVLGNGAASLISLLALPVLVRLFAPEALGSAAIFASVLAILGALVCARYEMSIVPADDDRQAANMLAVSLMFSVLITALSVLLVLYFAKPLCDALNYPEMAPWFWLLPPSLLAHGVYSSFNYWNTRTKHFSRLAVTQIGGQALNSGGALAGGAMGYVSGGMLIFSALLGKAAMALTLAFRIIRQDGHIILRSISLREMMNGMARHKKFLLFGTWSILLGIGAWQLPILLLGHFFAASVVGFYALGFRILQMPMSLVGSAIGQVFFQTASYAKSQGNLPGIVDTLFKNMVGLFLLPMLVLAIVGQDLFIIAFGAEWSESGLYTQILVPWAFFWFLSAPFTPLFSVLDKQGTQLAWNILNFGTRVGAVVIGGLYEDARLAIILLSIAGFFLYGGKLLLSLHISQGSIKQALGHLIRNGLIFLPIGAFLITLSILDISRWGVAVAALIICAVHAAHKIPIFMRDLNKEGIIKT